MWRKLRNYLDDGTSANPQFKDVEPREMGDEFVDIEVDSEPDLVLGELRATEVDSEPDLVLGELRETEDESRKEVKLLRDKFKFRSMVAGILMSAAVHTGMLKVLENSRIEIADDNDSSEQIDGGDQTENQLNTVIDEEELEQLVSQQVAEILEFLEEEKKEEEDEEVQAQEEIEEQLNETLEEAEFTLRELVNLSFNSSLEEFSDSLDLNARMDIREYRRVLRDIYEADSRFFEREINFGAYYLVADLLKGDINAEQFNLAQLRYAEILANLDGRIDSRTSFEELDRILNPYLGRYIVENKFMSALILDVNDFDESDYEDLGANCEGRFEYISSILHDVSHPVETYSMVFGAVDENSAGHISTAYFDEESGEYSLLFRSEEASVIGSPNVYRSIDNILVEIGVNVEPIQNGSARLSTGDLTQRNDELSLVGAGAFAGLSQTQSFSNYQNEIEEFAGFASRSTLALAGENDLNLEQENGIENISGESGAVDVEQEENQFNDGTTLDELVESENDVMGYTGDRVYNSPFRRLWRQEVVGFESDTLSECTEDINHLKRILREIDVYNLPVVGSYLYSNQTAVSLADYLGDYDLNNLRLVNERFLAENYSKILTLFRGYFFIGDSFYRTDFWEHFAILACRDLTSLDDYTNLNSREISAWEDTNRMNWFLNENQMDNIYLRFWDLPDSLEGDLVSSGIDQYNFGGNTYSTVLDHLIYNPYLSVKSQERLLALNDRNIDSGLYEYNSGLNYSLLDRFDEVRGIRNIWPIDESRMISRIQEGQYISLYNYIYSEELISAVFNYGGDVLKYRMISILLHWRSRYEFSDNLKLLLLSNYDNFPVEISLLLAETDDDIRGLYDTISREEREIFLMVDKLPVDIINRLFLEFQDNLLIKERMFHFGAPQEILNELIYQIDFDVDSVRLTDPQLFADDYFRKIGAGEIMREDLHFMWFGNIENVPSQVIDDFFIYFAQNDPYIAGQIWLRNQDKITIEALLEVLDNSPYDFIRHLALLSLVGVNDVESEAN